MVETVQGPNYTISIASLEHLGDAIVCWHHLVRDQGEHDDRISNDSISDLVLDKFLRSTITDSRLIIANDCNEKMIGIATISLDSNMLDSSSTVWNISDVWVHPDFRRHGIATQLVSKCELIAKKRGATEIRLQVYSTNQGASMMYGQLGYRTIVRTMRRKLT